MTCFCRRRQQKTNHAYWKNVPARVWKYTLGGYQVLKKWLSYREKAILGRGLSIDEVAYVQQRALVVV